MPPSTLSSPSNFFRMLVACVTEPVVSNPPSLSTLAARPRSSSRSLSGFDYESASDSGFDSAVGSGGASGGASRFRARSRSEDDEFTAGFSSASSTSSNASSPVARQASSASAALRTPLGSSNRPAWLSTSWRQSSAASTPVQAQRNEATELQQERHDRCAIHFTRTAASKKVTDDMLQAVELSLSKAYGTDIPPHLAQIVSGMKREAEQCALASDWLAPFGHAPLADAPAQRTISATDIAYAKQSAQRATNAAIACSQRLFALAEMTDASNPINAHELTQATLPAAPPATNHHIDIRKINASLAVIGSDAFQHTLVAGLTLEQRLQRGLQQAGAALQHAASDAVDWLIPTLRTEQPEMYAQQLSVLLPKARTTAAIDWVARPRFEETERCLGRSLLYAPQPTDESSHAEFATFRQLVVHLRDQSNTLYQQISDAATSTSRMASHDASTWRNLAQAERDVATATAQQHHAKVALPRLEALLAQAKTLPNATSGSGESINLTE